MTTERSDPGDRFGMSARAHSFTEEAGYLTHQNTQLYYFLHIPRTTPRAHILLAGPFASERHSTYVPWVRWARFLAGQGLEVMRFDYRGMGESSGDFEKLTFSSWLEDVKFCAAWLSQRAESRPVILNGLECGGLLAARAFAEGVGNALLLWSPPTSARDLLYDLLRQKLFIDYTSRAGVRRRVREDYIQDLETGKNIEVGGYFWSPELWKDAANFMLSLDSSSAQRPAKLVQLDRSAEPLIAGPNKWRLLNPPIDARPLPLNPNLDKCFTENLAWINDILGKG